MKLKLRAIFTLFLLTIFTFGCEIYRQEKGPSNPGALGKLQAQFPSINANILGPKCASCHSGANPPHGIYLNSYKAMMESNVFPPLVVPFNPEQSSLYTSVRDGKMPKDAPRLSSTEIKMIYDWIKAGAKEKPDDPGNGGPGNGSGLPGEPCDVIKVGNEPHFVPCKEELN